MDKKRKHIDDLFRDKLGSYTEAPPSDAWSDMDKKLDTLVPHARVTNPYRWLGHFGIVSLIVALGVSVISKFGGSSNSELAVADKQQIVNKIDNSSSSMAVDNATQATVETAVPESIESENDNTGTAVVLNARPADALGFGESYSENADNEYVEGVTEIRKEIVEENSGRQTGNGVSYNSAYAAGNSGNTSNAYGAEGTYGVNGAGNRTTATGTVAPGNTNTAADDQFLKRMNATLPADAPQKAAGTQLGSKANRMEGIERWNFGVKAGYERGFNNTAATAYVVSPYVSYNLSPKVAVMMQPAVKMANVQERTIGDARTYIKMNNDALVTATESFTTSQVEGTSVVFYNNTRYHYSRSHDEITKTNKTGGNYMQYELPVMVSYKVGKRMSAYAGVNVVYGKTQGVTEHTSTNAGIVRTADTLITSKGTPVAPAAEGIITNNGTSLAEYNGPIYPATREQLLRLGATVGLSYEYGNRWLVDALVQKTPAPAAVRAGYNINAPLSAPAFRVSVGYKIKK